jgi:hypothetical protein
MNKRRYLIIGGIVVAAVVISIVSYTMLANHEPVITSLEASPDTVIVLQSCQIVCSATDPDGDELTYGWSASGGGIGGQGAVVNWTAPQSAGSYNITAMVSDDRGGVVTRQVTVTARANEPPNTPSNPWPTDRATGVSIYVNLSWTGGDPDAGDTVTYDVYLGVTSSPPMVSNDQSGTAYKPGTLAYNTKYYWQIVATDNHGTSTLGPMWDFATQAETHMPPPLPHYFSGRVSTATGSVPEGTVVEAFVDGVKKAETVVTAQSTYELLVPGEYDDEGKTVGFTVGGVQASETADWHSAQVNENFDLTID